MSKYTPERIARLHAGREARQAALEQQRNAQIASGHFRCSMCGLDKPLNEFPSGRSRRDGTKRYAYCKLCHGTYQRAVLLKRNYGLTSAEYDTIHAFQGGVCAVCLNPPKRVRLAVDHDHKSGMVRGLLCAWCNRALGQFRDDIEKVRRVVSFFIDPPASRALGRTTFGIKGRVTNKAKTRRLLNPEKYKAAK